MIRTRVLDSMIKEGNFLKETNFQFDSPLSLFIFSRITENSL